MAAEVVLLLLLISEPLVVSVGHSAAPEYQFISNLMSKVALPFVWVLGVGAHAITRLNESIAAVPKMLTNEQLLTPAERAVFRDDFAAMDLGL